MEASREAFDWFVRRWQVRLFIAGFTLPIPLWVLLSFVLRRQDEPSAILSGLVGAALLLTCLLLQCWRIPRPARSRKRPHGSAHGSHEEAV